MTVLRRSAGFTLIELLMVVMILAIVLSLGVPSFTSMIKNNRLAAASNDVAGALHYARAEAVRRGRPVQVEALADDLSNGLRIWFDQDGDGSFDDNDEEELRLVRLPSAAGVAVVGSIDGGADQANIDLSYSPRGTVSGAGNRLAVTICDDRSGDHGKELSLLASGMLRLNSPIACN